MVWIERNLRLFQVTTAICAIVASAIVLWFNVPTGRSVELTRMKLGALFLPWLIGMLAFTPVLYLSWCRGVISRPRLFTIRVSIVVYLALVVVTFGGIYGHFVFELF